jgi:hypothetical protein
MNEGKTHNYFWIEECDFDFDDLVTKCPDLLLRKNIAITAFDGGPLIPNDEEKSLGWYSKDDVFYIPDITNLDKLPYDQYDEWYVFENLKEFKPIDPFVNYGAFFLRDPIFLLEDADPIWDKVGIKMHIDMLKEMQNKFWNFIKLIEPRSFIMDNGRFIFGSRFHEDIDMIKTKIEEAG